MKRKESHQWIYHPSKLTAKCLWCGKTCKATSQDELREKTNTPSKVGYCNGV